MYLCLLTATEARVNWTHTQVSLKDISCRSRNITSCILVYHRLTLSNRFLSSVVVMGNCGQETLASEISDVLSIKILCGLCRQ